MISCEAARAAGRVYAVVDLDDEVVVAKPRAAIGLRPLRKACARATGLHGFFSKKNQVTVLR